MLPRALEDLDIYSVPPNGPRLKQKEKGDGKSSDIDEGGRRKETGEEIKECRDRPSSLLLSSLLESWAGQYLEKHL